jgi:hypothetical protein
MFQSWFEVKTALEGGLQNIIQNCICYLIFSLKYFVHIFLQPKIFPGCFDISIILSDADGAGEMETKMLKNTI